MEELKACPQEAEALDILEAMLDVCDLDNPGPMFAGQHVRGGICKIMGDDAKKLRQYIADRRAAPENVWNLQRENAALKAKYDEINRYNISCTKKIDSLLIEKAQLHGAVDQMDPDFFKRKCRVCGCDWNHPCNDHDYWVKDNLCSACAEKLLGGKMDGKI